MQHRVTLTDDDREFTCDERQAVLLAMRDAGRACLPVGCRSGGCGVCRVQVLSGVFETGLMSAAQIAASDRALGIVLACQLYPRSDLRLQRLERRTATPPARGAASNLAWDAARQAIQGSKP